MKISIQMGNSAAVEIVEFGFNGPTFDRAGNYSPESLCAVEDYLRGRFDGNWAFENSDCWIAADGRRLFISDCDSDGNPLNAGVKFPCFG